MWVLNTISQMLYWHFSHGGEREGGIIAKLNEHIDFRIFKSRSYDIEIRKKRYYEYESDMITVI